MTPPVTTNGNGRTFVTDVLPQTLYVSIPCIEGEDDGVEEHPYRDRILGTYTALPIFALTTDVTFDGHIAVYTTGLLRTFSRVRVLRFEDGASVLMLAIAFSEDKGNSGVFPDLEEMFVCDKPNLEYPTNYGYLAEILAMEWGGRSLRLVTLHNTENLGDEGPALVEAFREMLGTERVRVVLTNPDTNSESA